jgi:hypothetical protein
MARLLKRRASYAVDIYDFWVNIWLDLSKRNILNSKRRIKSIIEEKITDALERDENVYDFSIAKSVIETSDEAGMPDATDVAVMLVTVVVYAESGKGRSWAMTKLQSVISPLHTPADSFKIVDYDVTLDSTDTDIIGEASGSGAFEARRRQAEWEMSKDEKDIIKDLKTLGMEVHVGLQKARVLDFLRQDLTSAMDEARAIAKSIAGEIYEERGMTPPVHETDELSDAMWDIAIFAVKKAVNDWMVIDGGLPAGYK